MQNWNEKYLLKYISAPDTQSASDNLLKLISKLGIKLNFRNFNSVYQIIDELNYSDYIEKIEKSYEKN